MSTYLTGRDLKANRVILGKTGRPLPIIKAQAEEPPPAEPDPKGGSSGNGSVKYLA